MVRIVAMVGFLDDFKQWHFRYIYNIYLVDIYLISAYPTSPNWDYKRMWGVNIFCVYPGHKQ